MLGRRINAVLLPFSRFFSCFLLYSLLYCVALASAAQAATFLSEPFMNASAPGWILGNSAALTSGGADPSGAGYLRLTSNAGNQKGYAIYDTAFSTTQGFMAEFEYGSWGGTGADGFTVFFYDGSISSGAFNIGDFGGSLGYANGCGVNGVTNAYVGIAFDEYGNFTNPGDRCKNGGTGRVANNVSLRGAGNGFGAGKYSYLTHAALSTATQRIDCPTSVAACGNGSARPAASSYFRKVRITMLPAGATYSVKVEVQFGSTAAYSTVINTYTLPTPIYPTLKIGMAASTGGSTNYHEIRNMNLYVLTALDVQLTKTASPTPTAYLQGFIDYTLTVKNNSSTSSASLVSISDALPLATGGTPTLQYVSATPSQGSCSYTLPTVSCSLGTVVPLATATVVIRVRCLRTRGSSFTNTASVSTVDMDSNSGNNSASATVNSIVVGTPSLTAIKQADVSNAMPGDVITYAITLINTGQAIPAGFVWTDRMSNFTQLQLDYDGAGPSTAAYQFLPNTSNLTVNTMLYSDNTVCPPNSADAIFNYTPVSGANGAPAGYDGRVTCFRLKLNGYMAAGSSVVLYVKARVE